MLDNNEVENKLIEYIGEDNLKLLASFYKKHYLLFPLLSQDGIIINTNQFYGQSIRDYINENLHIYPDKIKDYTQYDDYIYEMILNILKDKKLI